MIQPILPLFLVGTLGASYSLGTIATLTGIITLPASLVAGIFWDRFGYSATFVFSAAIASVALILFIVHRMKLSD